LVRILGIFSSVCRGLYNCDVAFFAIDRAWVVGLLGGNSYLVGWFWLLCAVKRAKSGMVFTGTAVNNWMGYSYLSQG
jgi:hypothetical protein